MSSPVVFLSAATLDLKPWLDRKPDAIVALREALVIYKELPAADFTPAQLKESEDLLKELAP